MLKENDFVKVHFIIAVSYQGKRSGCKNPVHTMEAQKGIQGHYIELYTILRFRQIIQKKKMKSSKK